MPFAKGNKLSKGRPAGAVNRSSEELKQTLVNIANNALDKIDEDIEKIRKKNPEKALDFALRLLEFVAPKLKSMDVNAHMQVDQRIHQIQVNISGSSNQHNKDV
jgi:predicted RNA-binding protein Jag